MDRNKPFRTTTPSGPTDIDADQALSLLDVLEYGAAMAGELAQLAGAHGQHAAAQHLRLASLALSDRRLQELTKDGLNEVTFRRARPRAN